METTKIITFTTLITLMLFSVNTYSQFGRMSGGTKNRASFETFDLDRNGQITALEFQKVRAERQSENAKKYGMKQKSASAPSFKSIDLNSDGLISPSEFLKNQANRCKNK